MTHIESKSTVSALNQLGSLPGLASRQFVQDLPEWHLVEHGFPAFLQEHCFPEQPFCSCTVLHSRHCRDWPTLLLHEGSQLELSPNCGYLSVVHHHRHLTHSRDRSSPTQRTCTATDTGNEHCHGSTTLQGRQ